MTGESAPFLPTRRQEDLAFVERMVPVEFPPNATKAALNCLRYPIVPPTLYSGQSYIILTQLPHFVPLTDKF